MELEKYRQPWENNRHWELRKEFLQFYKDFFHEDKLQCLAQVYSNIEVLQCSYPTEVMLEIQKLTRHLKACKKVPDSKQNTVKDKRKNEKPEPSESKKQCKSEDKTTHECLPLGVINVQYKTLAQSENFNIVEKLTVEVQKLLQLQQSVNAFDLVLSAALHLNCEDMIDLKYTQHPAQESDSQLVRYYCEFFIGTTKLSIGSGENRYIAKKTASENALDTLSVLPLMEGLGIEVQRLLDNSPGDSAFDTILTAALNLGMEDSICIKLEKRVVEFPKGSCEREFCGFFIGPIKMAEAFAVNKHYAKMRAFNNGLVLITHLKDVSSGNLEHEKVCWTPKETPKKSSGEWDKELLEQLAFEMKRSVIKKKDALTTVYESFSRLGKLDDLVYKFRRDMSSPNVSEHFYVCDVLVNNAPMGSGKAPTKKKSKSAAAESLMKFFMDLFERKRNSMNNDNVYADVLRLIDEHSHKSPPADVNERTREAATILPDLIPASASFTPLVKAGETANYKITENSIEEVKSSDKKSFSVNKRLYDNSIKQDFLIFDRTGSIPKGLHASYCSELCYSVQHCRRILTFNYHPPINGTYRVDILIDNKIVATGIAGTKAAAKTEAARIILEKYQKEIYTIKVNENEIEEMIEINPSDMKNLRFDVSKTKTSRRRDRSPSPLLKSCHRKDINKIICPGNKNFAKVYRHFAAKAGEANLAGFKAKLATLMEGYRLSDSTIPLKFTEKFAKERQLILLFGRRFSLVYNKYQKKSDKNVYLRRKISVKEHLDGLIKAGGKTARYELVDLSN